MPTVQYNRVRMFLAPSNTSGAITLTGKRSKTSSPAYQSIYCRRNDDSENTFRFVVIRSALDRIFLFIFTFILLRIYPKSGFVYKFQSLIFSFHFFKSRRTR